MSELRASFVAAFGEEDAVAIERASSRHMTVDVTVNGPEEESVPDGVDPFARAFVFAINWGCLVSATAKWHGIIASEADLKDWARKSDVVRARHQAFEPLTLLSKGYDEWME